MTARRLVPVCFALAFSFIVTPAVAEPGAVESTAKPRAVKRRAERHDRDRSAALKRGERMIKIDTVVVQGRPGRPQAAVETSVQPFQFPVGTARYSGADQRYIDRSKRERW